MEREKKDWKEKNFKFEMEVDGGRKPRRYVQSLTYIILSFIMEGKCPCETEAVCTVTPYI